MKKATIDIFISDKNVLHLRVKDTQTSFDLTKYSYDINKPFAENNNFFINENLVNDIQGFVKSNISKFLFIYQPTIFYIAIAKRCDKDGYNHILDFADLIGANIIELAYLNSTDDKIPDRQLILDNKVASRNCQIGQQDTQFFDKINTH